MSGKTSSVFMQHFIFSFPIPTEILTIFMECTTCPSPNLKGLPLCVCVIFCASLSHLVALHSYSAIFHLIPALQQVQSVLEAPLWIWQTVFPWKTVLCCFLLVLLHFFLCPYILFLHVLSCVDNLLPSGTCSDKLYALSISILLVSASGPLSWLHCARDCSILWSVHTLSWHMLIALTVCPLLSFDLWFQVGKSMTTWMYYDSLFFHKNFVKFLNQSDHSIILIKIFHWFSRVRSLVQIRHPPPRFHFILPVHASLQS